MPPWCRPSPTGTLLDVVVQPRASKEGVGPVHGDRLKVRVHAPPVDNEANDAVVQLVARTLGLPRSAVTIAAGRTGRCKTLAVEGLGPDRLLQALAVLIGT